MTANGPSPRINEARTGVALEAVGGRADAGDDGRPSVSPGSSVAPMPCAAPKGGEPRCIGYFRSYCTSIMLPLPTVSRGTAPSLPTRMLGAAVS